MKKTIWWDMDGTIANLYAVENWLDKLRAEDVSPYVEAEVLLNMSQLARLMNKVQRAGYKLGIISWTARSCTDSYADAIVTAKLNWLKLHLASVHFDEICIVNYGIPKYTFMDTENDILFDDEEGNRNAWKGEAFEPDMMIEILKSLMKGE